MLVWLFGNPGLKDEKPVIEAFLDWADKQVVTGNSKFSKALTCFKNRRNDLMTYLEDGHCSLSNNWSENSIRPVTVGRKNWLFSSFVDGAEASMNIYTIIEMAKIHNLSSRYIYRLVSAICQASGKILSIDAIRFDSLAVSQNRGRSHDYTSDVHGSQLMV